jgi:hypothetical protein
MADIKGCPLVLYCQFTTSLWPTMASSSLEWEISQAEARARHLRSVLRRNSDRGTTEENQAHLRSREPSSYEGPRYLEHGERGRQRSVERGQPRDYSLSPSPRAYYPRGNDINQSCLSFSCPQGLKYSAHMMEKLLWFFETSVEIHRLFKTDSRDSISMKNCLSITKKNQ